MRKALVVGIDNYENCPSLSGCVNDANSVNSVLARHSDGTINFAVKLLTATSPSNLVTKKDLKKLVIDLFKYDDEVALFYFSGHGYLDENSSGYLVTSDCLNGDDGFPMSELHSFADKSPAKNKIIILDCCHSGGTGNVYQCNDSAVLNEGTTILTASAVDQYAIEENGSGVFTKLLVDAMNGSAANLVGDITPGSIYAHIDQSLGPWEQRPIFKTNVKYFTSLRKAEPPIPLDELRMIVDLFQNPGEEFQLDPDYEPETGSENQEKMDKFAILQKYNRVYLVVPVGEKHMYHAAIHSKSCKLTILGEHYWNLVNKRRI